MQLITHSNIVPQIINLKEKHKMPQIIKPEYKAVFIIIDEICSIISDTKKIIEDKELTISDTPQIINSIVSVKDIIKLYPDAKKELELDVNIVKMVGYATDKLFTIFPNLAKEETQGIEIVKELLGVITNIYTSYNKGASYDVILSNNLAGIVEIISNLQKIKAEINDLSVKEIIQLASLVTESVIEIVKSYEVVEKKDV